MLERVRFGRTELLVSPAGLGCGGSSRLGMGVGGDEHTAERVLRQGIDLGINFFDTARVYGTEEVVGRAVAGSRQDVAISSKTMFRRHDAYMAAEELVDSLEKSLKRLKSDYVDVFSLHGVTDNHLDYCLEEYVPELERQRALGKIRYLGITESFAQEPQHDMLIRAIPSGCFDVVMVGFNLLNPVARERVFQAAIEHDVAIQVMHAVRRALSNPARLRETVAELIERGEVDPAVVDPDDPLGFVERAGESVIDIAYRYCRHEPGVSVVLTGTGSTEHLAQNVAAISGPPIPDGLLRQLDLAFGQVCSTSAD